MSNNFHKRGFGSMSAEKRKAIAALGGKAAWEMGVAHKFTPDEAKAASKLVKTRGRRKQPATAS